MSQKREIRRILIVDDEQKMCATLTKSLLSTGYECESTTDPGKALEILEVGSFELAILDINMPQMDGLKLLNQMSRGDPGIDTIMMTGYTDVYSYSDIIKAGAADFIAKPFAVSELEAKIERISRERKLQRDLQELNTGLGVLLQGVEREKQKLGADVIENVKELIRPYLEKLKGTHLNAEQRTYLEILESNLADICSPFIKKLSHKHANLSPMEIQVATLIKAGKENKEIAQIFGVSLNTVVTHRYHIRTKLGVKGKQVNLSSYLSSIDL
ncbi:MAG: response regulator [Syntrophobacteraceae bacterium]